MAPRFTDSEFFYVESSDKSRFEIVETHLPLSPDLRDSAAFEIGYSVPEVQAVFALLLGDDRVLHIWTVVPERNHDTYRKIYAKEKELIKQFEGIAFDFNIIPSRGRDPRTLISAAEAQLAFIR